MASEAQANAPARHPLQRSVLLTLVLSVAFPRVYDSIWLSRVYDYYPNKRGYHLPPLWPMYVGAVIFVLFVSSIFVQLIEMIIAKPSTNVRMLRDFYDFVHILLQTTTFPLRIYGLIIIKRVFPRKGSRFFYIVSLILALFIPCAIGQYRINKMLIERSNKTS